RQVRIEEEQPARRQACQPPIEARCVGDDLARALLERDENPGHAAASTVDEALQREHGLARAGAAEEKAGAMARQPAAAHRVESLDAGGQLARILDGGLAARYGC